MTLSSPCGVAQHLRGIKDFLVLKNHEIGAKVIFVVFLPKSNQPNIWEFCLVNLKTPSHWSCPQSWKLLQSASNLQKMLFFFWNYIFLYDLKLRWNRFIIHERIILILSLILVSSLIIYMFNMYMDMFSNQVLWKRWYWNKKFLHL